MSSRLCCFALALVLVLCVSLPASAAGPPRVIEGVYIGSEAGDYNYLLLRTPQGQELSFFCNYVITEILDAYAPKLPISVTFVHDTQYLEAAGQEIEMQIVQSVFIPDEYAPDFGVTIKESPRP